MSENLSESKALCSPTAAGMQSETMLNHPAPASRSSRRCRPSRLARRPGHPATARAADATEVTRLAGAAQSIGELDALISVCRACPRLVTWREQVASVKRKSFADQPYWGDRCPAGVRQNRRS